MKSLKKVRGLDSTRKRNSITRKEYFVWCHSTKRFSGAVSLVNCKLYDRRWIKAGWPNSPIADEIVKSSLDLIEVGGMAEYNNPHTGKGCGGGHFTWTAEWFSNFY